MTMKIEQKVEALCRYKGKNIYWQDRILAQVEFAWNLCKRDIIKEKNKYYQILENTSDKLLRHLSAGEGVGKDFCLECEADLKEFSPIAKEFKVLCAGHGHIDMNWTWRFDETVSVVLDTVKTMLRFLEEYPSFTYSHSQVMTYSIIEEYCPELIPTILEYARQGRWEILGSVWVEADKNTPCLESNKRQLFYAHQFMKKIGAENLLSPVGFEPDAFGHHALIPELFTQANLKYYYHCRGLKETLGYRWQTSSGKELIAFREPFWYDEDTDEGMAYGAFALYDGLGFTTSLRSYGVGNHGGGPTRADIQKIQDYNTWMCFPSFKFSTYAKFFEFLENQKEKLPFYNKEKNFVHTACFSSQSRIVRSNKNAEQLHITTGASEVLNMALGTKESSSKHYHSQMEKAWKKTLFSQFHDILPGSCTDESRDFALGQYQESFALANTERTRALREFFSSVDRSYFGLEKVNLGNGEGGGVGYGVAGLQIAQTGYSDGDTRVFGVYNPLQSKYNGLLELVVWDWNCNAECLHAFDGDGNELEVQYVSEGEYWRHYYKKILVKVDIDAFSYNVIYVRDSFGYELTFRHRNSWRTNAPYTYTLENDYIRAEFDEKTFELKSLYSKELKKELCSFGGFQFLLEDNSQKADAWMMGRFISEESFHSETSLLEYKCGLLRSYLIFRLVHKSSHLIVQITLDKEQRRLDYSVKVYWNEISTDCTSTYLGGAGIDWLYPAFPPTLKRTGYLPQLAFRVRPTYNYKDVIYDAVGKVEKRDYKHVDIYGLNYCAPLAEDNSSECLQIIYTSGNAFRDSEKYIDLTLLRSTPKPDPYMEVGQHQIYFSVACLQHADMLDLIAELQKTYTPLIVPCRQEKGELASCGWLLKTENIILESFAPAESNTENSNEKAFILHFSNPQQSDISAKIDFAFPVKEALFCSVLEESIGEGIEIKENSLYFSLKGHEIKGVKVKF